MRVLYALFVFFLFFYCHTTAQTFGYAFGIGGTGYDTAEAIDTDNAGNVYVAGRFENSMDVDPGTGVTTLISSGNYDVYIAKFSAASELIWAVSFGSTQFDYASAIAWTPDGVYVNGAFRNTVDFDPGPGSTTATSAGDEDIFHVLFTDAGVFEWVRTNGGIGEDHPDGLSVDINGDLVSCGLFSGTADFDPGAGVVNFTSLGSQDSYIQKLDGDGNFLWAHPFGTSPGEFCNDVDTDASGNIFATGIFYGTLDFDPGPGVFNLVADNSYTQSFLLKWTPAGDFIWAGMFGGSQADSSYDLVVDDNDNVIVTGYFNGSGDFDPGPGVFTLVTESSLFFADLFILKLANNGDFTWAKGIGVNGTLQTGYAIDAAASGDIAVTGMYDGTVDFDPGPGVNTLTNYGVSDVFILHLSPQGDFEFAGHVGGSQGDYGSAIIFNNPQIIVAGSYSWIGADMDPTDDVYTMNSVGNSNDGFLIGLSVTDCIGDNVSQEFIICPGDSVFAGGAYQTDPGIYTDVYTNQAGCDSIITSTVTMAFGFIPMNDTLGCEGTSVILTTNSIVESYAWSSLEDTPSIEVTESGTYSVTLTQDECVVSDTAEVIFYATPAITFEFPDASCSGIDEVTAVATGEGPFSYAWDDPLSQQTATATNLAPGLYTVTVEDANGCIAEADVEIQGVSTCPTDFDGDNVTGISDLMMFIAAYGCPNSCCPFDINGDGVVSVNDLVSFISAYGSICQ